MARPIPSPLSLALTFLRSAQGWSQKELAEAVGIPGNLISDYERGRKTLSRERLEDMVAVLGLPPAAIEAALDFLQTVRAASQGSSLPGEEGGWRIESVAHQTGRLAAEFARTALRMLTAEARALDARQQAAGLWQRLKRYSPAQRRLIVEEMAEFRTWALCELLCAESVKAAADNAERALELAELALRLAELSPGEEGWRRRLQGYAWAHVGNSRRVRGDLPAAEEAFIRSRKLWQDGAPGDSGLLEEAHLLDLEASLRRDQRRLPAALQLLDQALLIERGTLTKRLLLNKANALLIAGDFAAAVAVLRRATPLIEAQGEPRFKFALRFNLAVNLCFLGRFGEAEALLPELRRQATGLRNDLDFVRLRWLEGKLAAGLGRKAEALEILSAVREEFAGRNMAYDAALVCLELAVLYLEEGRNLEVRKLARQMAPIFQAQGVAREALAALRLFRDAAESEAVSLELVRRLVAYFHRAQHDPTLRFEPA